MRLLRVSFASLMILTILGALGCKRANSKASIQLAIDEHLRQRRDLMMTNMTTSIEDVKFAGDTADATVKFTSKQSADQSVVIHYTLRRVGDHWEVTSGSAAGRAVGNPHAGSTSPEGVGAAPSAAPPHSQPAPEARH